MRCTATTKAGKPCANGALTGTKFCISHAPKEVQESRGFGGSQPGAGRPPTPRVVDVIRDRIEADVDTIVGVLQEALTADRGIALTVKGGGMEIGYVADHEVRIKAAKELLDRAYGRPKQQTEISAPDGGPVRIDLSALSDAELQQLAKLTAKLEA